MTGQELTGLAMNRCGFKKPGELAKRLGLGAYSSPRRISRWLDGETRPNYEATMAMLDLLGAINWDVLAQPASPTAIRAAVATSKRRTKELERLLDGPSEPRSADPGTP